MGWGDQIDITATLFLQIHHHLGKIQFVNRETARPFRMADIVILAKDAEQTATAEKDGSRTVLTHQYSLLPKMGPIADNL